MAYFMGVDIGSRTCKGLIAETGGRVAASHVMSPGTDYVATAMELRDRLLEKGGLVSADISYVVATGHSIRISYMNEYVTDIRCCARGVHSSSPSVRTIVDVQAQTSQVIRLGPNGFVNNFVVSEKCAAGSGRFLDVVAHVLGLEVEEVGRLALTATHPVSFSTGCAVFGESEAISRVAEGMSRQDILAGVHRSIADKINALVARVGMEQPCAMVGGGALNEGLVESIGEKLGIKVVVPPRPELISALGAAVIAEVKGSEESFKKS